MIILSIFYVSNYFLTAEILAEFNADILRKKKSLENRQIQENKLSLAQINGRLSELHIKRNELQQEKQALLSQTENINKMNIAIPKTGLKWYSLYQ